MYNPYDHYFKQAKKKGYKARSAFKLDEIQQKFKLFDKDTHTVLDIGCSPGSRLQYAVATLKREKVKKYKVIGFDIKETEVNLPGVTTYVQDIREIKQVEKILLDQGIYPGQVDIIISDMAPNTIGLKDIDAIRAFALLEQTLWMYETYLKPNGKFAVKVFMWPWFEEFVANMKKLFWGRNIKVFKPDACRKASKETYVIKFR